MRGKLIRITQETKEELDKLRILGRDVTYDEVIMFLLVSRSRHSAGWAIKNWKIRVRREPNGSNKAKGKSEPGVQVSQGISEIQGDMTLREIVERKGGE